jgi:hypothetical protein
LSEIRQLVLTLKGQIQIYKYGKFEKPGTREEEYAHRAQIKPIGSRMAAQFNGWRNITSGDDGYDQIDCGARQKPIRTTLKQVMGKFRDAYVQVNGTSVGRIIE